MTPLRRLVALCVGGLLLVGLAGIAARALAEWQHDTVVWTMFGAVVVYAAAAALALASERSGGRATDRRALLVVLGVAVLARAMLIAEPPVSTDIYRYVWDGRVQAAGVNPYRYKPADPQLSMLRDGSVYPKINRADTAVTIYPPLAQVIFLAVTRVSDSVTGMKSAMVAFDLAAMAVLLALLRARGLPQTRVIFYAWHPLPLFEFAGSGHVDAASIALMMAAFLAAERRRPLCAGALLGAAALVKFFPAVVAPALYRRWGWRFPAALLLVAAALYVPYLGAGRQVLGFLPGYFHEEGLTDGSGFFLLNLWSAAAPLPRWGAVAYLVAGAALLAGLGFVVLLRRDPSPTLNGALLLLAAFTLWISPHLAWYFTWVIPFFCFNPSWALIYLTAAAPLLYDIVWSPGALTLHAALYVPCGVIFAIEWWRHSRHKRLESPNDGSLGSRHAG